VECPVPSEFIGSGREAAQPEGTQSGGDHSVKRSSEKIDSTAQVFDSHIL